MASRLIDFLKTVKFHIQEVKINALVKEIPIGACKKVTIIHEHNKAVFEITSGKFRRNYVYYKYLDQNIKGSWPYLDRLLITEILEPKQGSISFSQEIYVHKIIIEF